MTAQLERLKQDALEFDTYINKIKKRGKTDLLSKLNVKKQFLSQALAGLQYIDMQ